MQKITPCLWFDGKAEEAMNFYMSIFKNAKCVNTMYHSDAGPGEKGSVLTTTFQLDGQEFIALNGGPNFTFNPAISLFVACQTQEEINHYWNGLLVGGEAWQCGWLKDKYGVSWQVAPTVLLEMLQDKDPEKSNRVMRAMMQMVKLDIAPLKKAYDHA